MIIALIIPTLIGGALMSFLPADNKAGLLAGNFLTNTVGSSEYAVRDALHSADQEIALPMLYSWITANCQYKSPFS